MKILLTGGSGYLGSLLVDSWLEDERVEKIIVVDLEDPKFLFDQNHPKVHFIKANLADLDLEKAAEAFTPVDAVVHAAYLIRTPYFKRDRKFQERSNFLGAENAFKFTLRNNISKLIHFSTVAIYGASPENNLNQPFHEEDDLKEENIAYGRDKKLIERDLEAMASRYRSSTEVFVLRIGSVSGPFGKYVVKKRGLLFFFRGLLPFIPVTGRASARQFVHEDDVISAVNHCLFHSFDLKSNVLNIAPDGYLTFSEIAKILGKWTIFIPRALAALAFFLLWRLSFGKIPTPPGIINSYSFPIIVDGSKITRLGFRYTYTCLDAFLGLKGKFKNLRPR